MIRRPSVVSLCSGIGRLDLGLERAGWHVAAQLELDPFCRAILAQHWPEVPRHDDIRTFPAWWHAQPRPPVERLADTPTPAGPTPRELGTADAFIPLTTLSDSLRPTDHGTSHDGTSHDPSA